MEQFIFVCPLLKSQEKYILCQHREKLLSHMLPCLKPTISIYAFSLALSYTLNVAESFLQSAAFIAGSVHVCPRLHNRDLWRTIRVFCWMENKRKGGWKPLVPDCCQQRLCFNTGTLQQRLFVRKLSETRFKSTVRPRRAVSFITASF